jgi:carboxylesterase type B
MQAFTTRPDMYAKHVPEFLAPGPYSEDCLYLNVFAPVLEETGEGTLPTVVFFYGGEGEWGGINAEYSQPVEWVERSRGHIVVLFKLGCPSYVPLFFRRQCEANTGKYSKLESRDLWLSQRKRSLPRTSRLVGPETGVSSSSFYSTLFPSHLYFMPCFIFDDPNARISLEFLRTNIHLFGGSPARLIAYGHAAGSGSIEAHLFAWPDDPIVSGAICMSGFLPMGGTTRDMERKSWSLLARRLGCPDDASPEEEVEFMRAVDAGAILGCFRAYNDSDGVETKLFFRPQVDGRVLFTPEKLGERARRGEFAKVVS